MTAYTPSHLVPKLRFPEFDAAPEWEEHSLGEVCEMKAGDFVRASEIFDVQKDGFFPCYGGNGLRGFVKTYTHRGLHVLIGRQGALCGNVNLFDGCFHATEHALVATPSSGIDTHWLYYALDILKLNRFATGQAQPGLSVTILNALPVTVPAYRDEQKKIADCLGSLDDLIAAEGRKLEALRKHKQGLMQQLFPEAGEAVPFLRFPEFRDKGEWEERKAGSLFVNRVNTGEEGLPIFSVTMHDGMVRRDSLDRNYYDIEEAAGNKKACKNDIVYNMMRMWQGALGVAFEDCLVSPAYIVLAPQKYVVSRFFEYLFKLPTSLLLLTSYSRGLTKDRLRLYYDDFARIPLRCPSEAEQQRIADCLSSLDTQIARQGRKLEMLKQHKQGLLQQLFPILEEESR
jgi:type I restriction enzyme, S subunit